MAEEKTIAGVTKIILHSYNLDGSLVSLTYPDGRTVNYTYSGAQRPLTAVGASGTNYAQNATYWPQGALDQDLHGYVSGGFGGITESWSYNPDLEPTSISASSSAGSALNLSYGFANNGSVTSIGNGNDSGRNESFSYDPLGRILQAQTQAGSGQDCWGLNFGTGGNLADDALGNLLSMSVFKCSGPSLSVSVNGNNQISSSGFSYDADGDMTADALYSYTFNGANEITSANGVNYTYDGNGLRVEKSSGTLFWRAYTGQVIEETNASGGMQRDYINFAADPGSPPST